MVIVRKTWETVYFTANNKDNQEVTIELDLNFDTGKYTICTSNQEMVSFNNERIEISELKMEALTEVFKYIKKSLPKEFQPKKKK
jgi:hypothetical protein